LKIINIDNEFYSIVTDLEINRVYLTLRRSFTDHETDSNIANNLLSYLYRLEDRFNLLLDLRLYDPRIKKGYFFKRMKDIANRLNELNGGPQVHLMNDILWSIFEEKHGLEPVPPAITDDPDTGEKIARFNDMESGEEWLDNNGWLAEQNA
jgi:hypothetical protein